MISYQRLRIEWFGRWLQQIRISKVLLRTW